MSKQVSEELKKKLEEIKDMHKREIADLQRHYESQIDGMKSSNEKVYRFVYNSNSFLGY